MISKKGLTSLYQNVFEFLCYHFMLALYIWYLQNRQNENLHVGNVMTLLRSRLMSVIFNFIVIRLSLTTSV